MLERKKYCPVCGELVAVYQGDPDKYGDRAEWNWNRYIRLRYDCDECRKLMKGQSTRVSNRRRRAERRDERTTLLDIVAAYRERVGLLEQENRATRQRIAELEQAARAQ